MQKEHTNLETEHTNKQTKYYSEFEIVPFWGRGNVDSVGKKGGRKEACGVVLWLVRSIGN